MSKLAENPELVAQVADRFRKARGAGPWSTENLPGQDSVNALATLALVDRHLASTPSAEVSTWNAAIEAAADAAESGVCPKPTAPVSGCEHTACMIKRDRADKIRALLKPTGETAPAKCGESHPRGGGYGTCWLVSGHPDAHRNYGGDEWGGETAVKARDAELLAAVIAAIKAEHLEEPQNAEDEAYDAAINAAINAIKKLAP